MKTDYALHIPAGIARRLQKFRPALRNNINAQLNEVVKKTSASPTSAVIQALGPPLRFYAGNYRIFYRVELASRTITVLELRSAFA